MSITAVALRYLVASELGFRTGNMPVTPDQDADLEIYNSGARAYLIEEGLCYWPADEIPDAVKLPLSYFVAGQAAEFFGRGPRSEDPYDKGDTGLAGIRIHCSKRSAREPVQATYF